MKKILFFVGIILIIYGFCLCMLSNLNLGTAAVCLLGIFFTMWGIFYKRLGRVTEKGIMRLVKCLIIILLCLEGVLTCFIAVYGQIDNVDYREDAVIVLGAGVRGERVTLPLKLRLDKAVEYHQQNPDSVIVVTGGKGFQETITEAEAMERYLAGQGVDRNVIIKEDKATSTNENMRFSKEILDAYFDGNYRCAVITNGFHIYRGVSIAKLEGLGRVTHMHAGLKWYNLLPCYIRESLAVLKMWVFGWCIKQHN